jgi:hypothetical protein
MCRIVFKLNPFTLQQVCQLVWRDTYYVGMAHIRQIRQNFACKEAKRQKNIATEFAAVLCRNDIFCFGSLSTSK